LLQSVLCPYPRHHHVRQRRTQLAQAPMRRPVGRFPLKRPIRMRAFGPSPAWQLDSPASRSRPNPFAPAGDERIVAPSLSRICGSAARCGPPPAARSAALAPPIVRSTAPARPLAQFPTFPFCQWDRAPDKHDHTTCSPVTHHLVV
jgi:hypothetical protein